MAEIRNYPATFSKNPPREIKKISAMDWTLILGPRRTDKETDKERKRGTDREFF
jgi:hypothetical protein